MLLPLLLLERYDLYIENGQAAPKQISIIISNTLIIILSYSLISTYSGKYYIEGDRAHQQCGNKLITGRGCLKS